MMYQWYIDNGTCLLEARLALVLMRVGQYHALLTQDEAYGHLLTKFFDEPAPGSKTKQRYPELSWVHHIACKRYGHAASATNQLRLRSTVLDDKEVSGLLALSPTMLMLAVHQQHWQASGCCGHPGRWRLRQTAAAFGRCVGSLTDR